MPEIKLILREVYGKGKIQGGPAANSYLVQSANDRKWQPGLNIKDFCEFCRHHPALFSSF